MQLYIYENYIVIWLIIRNKKKTWSGCRRYCMVVELTTTWVISACDFEPRSW